MPRYSSRTGQLLNYQVGPFDSSHLYVQWGGKLPGDEQWSCGFRMWNDSAINDTDAANAIAGIGVAVRAYHLRQETNISPNAKLSYVKVNAIDVDGKYMEQSTREIVYPDVAGGGYTNVVPNQIAMAVSLTTGFSRGPAHRGRFYNPLPTCQVGVDGRVDVGTVQAVAASAETLRTAVNAVSPSSNLIMVVMSRKAGAPGHRAVTGVEVGRVLDTQRRRRRSLLEDARPPV